MTSEQQPFLSTQHKQIEEILRLNSKFHENGLEKLLEIVTYGTIAGKQNLCDDIVNNAPETAASFADDLAGLAPNDIIQSTDSALDSLHSEGVEMISEMCYFAVSQLLMLGRSVIYNAKNADGKSVVCASKIDDDIMNIDWPVDCREKAQIIRIRGIEMTKYLEAVFNSFVTGISKVGEAFVAVIECAAEVVPIQEEVDEYSENLLRVGKGTAVEEIQLGLSMLAYLVNSTSVPVD